MEDISLYSKTLITEIKFEAKTLEKFKNIQLLKRNVNFVFYILNILIDLNC